MACVFGGISTFGCSSCVSDLMTNCGCGDPVVAQNVSCCDCCTCNRCCCGCGCCSGCGCSASVLCSYIMHRLEQGDFGNILFMSTGALMSPTSSFQGESIPGIAHLLNIKKEK